MKKIELKVNIHCQRCSTEVLQSATKLTGIDHISVDGEKGIVTVIGDVDPVLVTSQVRKTGKIVQIISVSPHRPPEKKPSDEKKK
ncbi:heavy metal-associated isoprenylated plant protein 2 [Rhododendron vialii]|uniref:heavy metal-associated isoprenylated plant protein 2 n=1 Tax=Rhododendron vialii TaxID=182163 RepID=UPI00265FEC5B|nr:heavy metal-associated isoprenylated plant protein 2 [Rhododendron vialii]